MWDRKGKEKEKKISEYQFTKVQEMCVMLKNSTGK